MTIKPTLREKSGERGLTSGVYGAECVFISGCKTRYICVSEGVPCFTRTAHTEIIKAAGLSPDGMENVTFKFYYTGNGCSVRDFLSETSHDHQASS